MGEVRWRVAKLSPVTRHTVYKVTRHTKSVHRLGARQRNPAGEGVDVSVVVAAAAAAAAKKGKEKNEDDDADEQVAAMDTGSGSAR